MAYNPATGEWEDEDTSVSKRLTGLLAKDSDYLKSAGTVGAQSANRRGLLNSSIATEAVESARIKAALPIASQEAGHASSRELLGRQLQTADLQQRREITSREGMQGLDIESREGMQRTDIASREGMQGRDIESREGMQLRDIASRAGLQAEQLAQLDQAQLRDIASREGMQEADLQGLLDRQQAVIASQQFMQSLDLETRQLMQGLDIEAQLRIANLNIATNERNAAASLAASFEASYSNLLASIMNNPEIPAAERQRYMDHASRIRDSNLALVEQMYGIDLQWEEGPGIVRPPIPNFPGTTRI